MEGVVTQNRKIKKYKSNKNKDTTEIKTISNATIKHKIKNVSSSTQLIERSYYGLSNSQQVQLGYNHNCVVNCCLFALVIHDLLSACHELSSLAFVGLLLVTIVTKCPAAFGATFWLCRLVQNLHT